jgi:hypothetical protein
MLYPETDPATEAERTYLNKQFTNLFAQLRYTDKLGGKSASRQLAGIRSRLRRDLLLFYNPDAELGDAFRLGVYNDLTAALLHALILDEFGISYTTYVDHWECLIITKTGDVPGVLAAPGSIRHTPAREETYRREYLNVLRKVLPEPLTQLSDSGADSVFYRYHYIPTQPLVFSELAAYAHFRRAERAYQHRNFRRSRRLLTHATTLTDRPAFTILDAAARLQLAALRRVDPIALENRLFELWGESPENSYYPAELLQRFDRRQREVLATGGPQAANDLLNSYLGRAPESQDVWHRRMQQLQGLRLIAYYQREGKLVPALHLAEALLRHEPDDERLQTFVAELLLTHLRRSYADPGELVDRAEAAAVRYPFLRGSDRYADIVLREAALEVRDLFAVERVNDALDALGNFRRQLSAIPNGNDRRLWTLTAFVAASNYYFQREDYAPARAYVAEALRHDPNNDYLLHQRDLLARY